MGILTPRLNDADTLCFGANDAKFAFLFRTYSSLRPNKVDNCKNLNLKTCIR